MNNENELNSDVLVASNNNIIKYNQIIIKYDHNIIKNNLTLIFIFAN